MPYTLLARRLDAMTLSQAKSAETRDYPVVDEGNVARVVGVSCPRTEMTRDGLVTVKVR